MGPSQLNQKQSETNQDTGNATAGELRKTESEVDDPAKRRMYRLRSRCLQGRGKFLCCCFFFLFGFFNLRSTNMWESLRVIFPWERVPACTQLTINMYCIMNIQVSSPHGLTRHQKITLAVVIQVSDMNITCYITLSRVPCFTNKISQIKTVIH